VLTLVGMTLVVGVLYCVYVVDWSDMGFLLGLPNIAAMFILNFWLLDSLFSERVGERQPPRILPEVQVDGTLPPHMQTVSYCPILLRSQEELSFINECLLPSLENNPDRAIRWVIVSASPAQVQEQEEQRILELQRRYGRDRVLYFHRHPDMRNWERKRGGYMQFMLWLQNFLNEDGTIAADPRFPSCPAGRLYDRMLGDIQALEGTRYFVIGDSDTVWPPNSIRRLVCKMAHPANREYVIFQTDINAHNPDASVMTRAYTFTKNAFKRRGEGTWVILGHLTFFGHGAGWEIDRFLSHMAGKMREGYLSHDIIEAFFAKAALVTDVTTLEEWPSNLYLLEKQQYRWWLGTRMAAPFFGRRIRNEEGRWMRNPASLSDKFLLAKIFSTYLNPPIFLFFVTTASMMSYHIAPALIYLLLPFYTLLGRNIIWNQGRKMLWSSAKYMCILLLLTPTLIMMTTLFVLRTWIGDLVRLMRARPSSEARWLVQGSLPKPAPRQVPLYVKPIMTSAVIYGILGSVGIFERGAVVAALFFLPLAAAPLFTWMTSLPGDEPTCAEFAADVTAFIRCHVPVFAWCIPALTLLTAKGLSAERGAK